MNTDTNTTSTSTIVRNIKVLMLQHDIDVKDIAYQNDCSVTWVYTRLKRMSEPDMRWFAHAIGVPAEVLAEKDLVRVVAVGTAIMQDRDSLH